MEVPPLVAPRSLAAGLGARSDAAGLRRLAAHAALLAGTAAAIRAAGDGAFLLPALACHGVVQVALFAPLHECLHRTAFRSRRMNDSVARLLGLVHGLPARAFRLFHLAHHRHTQDPHRDPELAARKPSSRAGYLLEISGVPYWRARVVELLRHAAGRVDEAYVPPRGRAGVVREARRALLVYLGVAAAALGLGTDAPLRYWLVPALLGQPFLRLYLLAEHAGCPERPGALVNTRTTPSNAALRFLMWNMPYHAEHHALPSVPFHALPALHERLAPRLGVVARGYTAFHRSYLRGLRARAC